MSFRGAPVRAKNYYFKPGITYGLISSFGFSARKVEKGFVFDVGGSMLFPEDNEDIDYILSFLCSKLSNIYLDVINPTLNYQVGDIKLLPLLRNSLEESVKKIGKECVAISKEEWDSREESWDFKNNELLKRKGQDLYETFDLYKQYWKNKYYDLQKWEVELNRTFFQIYGLQDELEPAVPLGELTILKEEIDIVNDDLIFNQKEVFAQFISYAVGCIFGRYSLDKEGLFLANQGETLEDYLKNVEKDQNELTYLPDDDNIIPVLDDEWFEDDIVNRFYDFLKASFGKENFDKNLAFVEECLGREIRKYLLKDFYKDHIKRYKKRPIYWMFSSPKGSFNVLIYMHRYTPDTLNQILNGYLVEYREKLKSRIEHLDHIIETGSSVEQTKAGKEKDKLKIVLLELQEYEREILYPLAIERISIDLDDGVLVNYNKFGKAIQEVKGLNDKATKKKVRGFDWIDTEKII